MYSNQYIIWPTCAWTQWHISTYTNDYVPTDRVDTDKSTNTYTIWSGNVLFTVPYWNTSTMQQRTYHILASVYTPTRQHMWLHSDQGARCLLFHIDLQSQIYFVQIEAIGYIYIGMDNWYICSNNQVRLALRMRVQTGPGFTLLLFCKMYSKWPKYNATCWNIYSRWLTITWCDIICRPGFC